MSVGSLPSKRQRSGTVDHGPSSQDSSQDSATDKEDGHDARSDADRNYYRGNNDDGDYSDERDNDEDIEPFEEDSHMDTDPIVAPSSSLAPPHRSSPTPPKQKRKRPNAPVAPTRHLPPRSSGGAAAAARANFASNPAAGASSDPFPRGA